MRPTRFELHVVPMIRLLDRLHMQQFLNIDLWDYDTVSAPATAARIARALKADPADVMPPQTHGGPWPDEWVQLFQRWIAEGFPRLGLGTAARLTAQRNGDFVSLTADGSSPGPDVTFWFDRYGGPQDADFVLYQDAVGQSGLGQAYPVTEVFKVPASLAQVRVLDAAGIHAVVIS